MKPSKNTIFSGEEVVNLFGVECRRKNRIFDENNGLFVNQTIVADRPYSEEGYKKGSTITVELRFDDQCRNGHQDFAITGHVQEPGQRDWSKGGCIHEDIAKYFPELAHLIQWHLVSTDGPMHYPGNVTYLAGDRDCWGRAAGDPSSWDRVIKFGAFPITQKIGKTFSDWLVAARDHQLSTLKTNPHRVPWPPVPVAVEHEKKPGETFDFKPKYTYQGFERKWYECPFDSLSEALQFSEALEKYPFEIQLVPTDYSKGKARELDAARRVAVWPEATDEQLRLPKAELEALLKARLPHLLVRFKADMESIGMLWRERADNEEPK